MPMGGCPYLIAVLVEDVVAQAHPSHTSALAKCYPVRPDLSGRFGFRAPTATELAAGMAGESKA
jgi:hypothetical protein